MYLQMYFEALEVRLDNHDWYVSSLSWLSTIHKLITESYNIYKRIHIQWLYAITRKLVSLDFKIYQNTWLRFRVIFRWVLKPSKYTGIIITGISHPYMMQCETKKMVTSKIKNYHDTFSQCSSIKVNFNWVLQFSQYTGIINGICYLLPAL